MKLKLIDRLTLPTIFPTHSSFEKLIIIADIQKKIAITQDETNEFDIKTKIVDQEKGFSNVFWNKKGDTKEFDIEFTESESNLISELLKKTSSEEKLTPQLFPLYKLFVK